MFNVFKFHIGTIGLYWRSWAKIPTEEATKEIENFYGTKLNFIEGIK